ncbi:hypothetical protein C8Q80DRAFT_246850 [Daedaleopsis nitida]|nr:hypothetical protein C8Q80DRAFT_246850 [Daedaleopsis nitida]
MSSPDSTAHSPAPLLPVSTGDSRSSLGQRAPAVCTVRSRPAFDRAPALSLAHRSRFRTRPRRVRTVWNLSDRRAQNGRSLISLSTEHAVLQPTSTPNTDVTRAPKPRPSCPPTTTIDSPPALSQSGVLTDECDTYVWKMHAAEQRSPAYVQDANHAPRTQACGFDGAAPCPCPREQEPDKARSAYRDYHRYVRRCVPVDTTNR